MDESLEIRKLPFSHLMELVKILELTEAWKSLMAKIPKTLQKDNYECEITESNPHKYTSEHIKLIEAASMQYKKSCTQILFEEWGTSGRVRPALGHLLHLLIKVQLYRAADYVAVRILNKSAPERPKYGPAAEIPIDLEQIHEVSERKIINMTSHATMKENKKDNFIDKNLPLKNIVINNHIPQIHHNPTQIPGNNTEISDMIKFSTDSVNDNIPNLTDLGLNDSNDANLPILDDLLQDIPHVTVTQVSTASIAADNNLPILSDLLNTQTSIDHSSSTNSSSDLHLPITSNRSNSNKSLRSCPSPLPNLSLNTQLPHFPYQLLEDTTNDFDENPTPLGGRFLGSGSCGSVYLADRLFPFPVAIKKFKLDNVQVVNIDDAVTKQFCTEVELLSKYKHENLLSLLGYSCDGCTYCLIYDYIPGGALKDRLQNRHNMLIWTERLYIALGTAKAISYLHTANQTPLIHRDVKSANILLDEMNKPKLCDFGLIKLLPNQNTTTGTTVSGTSAYMAPEAFRGDISVKMDTFSFGVVLLELLTSLPPDDKNRDGHDLVTHVLDHCDDTIDPLLDRSAGTWMIDSINVANELFTIATECLKEKKLRPNMVEIKTKLIEIIQRTNKPI